MVGTGKKTRTNTYIERLEGRNGYMKKLVYTKSISTNGLKKNIPQKLMSKGANGRRRRTMQNSHTNPKNNKVKITRNCQRQIRKSLKASKAFVRRTGRLLEKLAGRRCRIVVLLRKLPTYYYVYILVCVYVHMYK